MRWLGRCLSAGCSLIDRDDGSLAGVPNAYRYSPANGMGRDTVSWTEVYKVTGRVSAEIGDVETWILDGAGELCGSGYGLRAIDARERSRRTLAATGRRQREEDYGNKRVSSHGIVQRPNETRISCVVRRPPSK